MHEVFRLRLIVNETELTLIRPVGPLCPPPPPSAIFPMVRERIWMAPRRSLTFFFESCATFKRIYLKIGPTVTRSRDLLSLHVSPKIAHFRDLCTKHMEKSFFLKKTQIKHGLSGLV